MAQKIFGWILIGLLICAAWAYVGQSGAQVQAVVLVSADAEWAVVKTLFPGQRRERSPFGECFVRKFDLPDGTSQSVVVLQGGWGKTSAAASTQFAIDRWNPGLLINLGTCGGFEGAVERGTIILAAKTVIYDIIERMGDAEQAIKDYASDIGLNWLKRPLPLPVLETVLVSADQDIDPKAIAMLRAKYGAVAADWESGAIAFVARRNAKRLLILRGVTDLVSGKRGEAYGKVEVFRANSETIMKGLFDALPAWLSAER
jgi:adenosylhomocysteine nucleosidase